MGFDLPAEQLNEVFKRFKTVADRKKVGGSWREAGQQLVVCSWVAQVGGRRGEGDRVERAAPLGLHLAPASLNT